jgi:hypothetical protein
MSTPTTFRASPDVCSHAFEGYYEPLDRATTIRRCRRCGGEVSRRERCQATTRAGVQCIAAVKAVDRCYSHGAKTRPGGREVAV